MLDQLTFSGASVVVSGAAAGIGRACCEIVAGLGGRVIAIDLNPEVDSIVAAADEPFGADARAYVADVSDQAAVRRVRDLIGSEVGEVAAVINCAGTNAFAPLRQLDLPAWQGLLDSDLTSTFLMIREFVEVMLSPGGSFVNVASTYAFTGAPQMAAYCAAKAGVVALTRQIAVELAPEGIRANSLCPGPTLTPRRQRYFDEGKRDRRAAERRTLLGRMATPDEVARVAVFLASRAASYMTGTAVVVDGGQLAFAGSFDSA